MQNIQTKHIRIIIIINGDINYLYLTNCQPSFLLVSKIYNSSSKISKLFEKLLVRTNDISKNFGVLVSDLGKSQKLLSVIREILYKSEKRGWSGW